MRSVILALLGVGGLLLAAGASAEEYSIVEGSFTDAATGESTALTGGLEIEPSGTPLADDTTLHSIDDFEFQVGDQTFLPSLPVEYGGQRPIGFLRAADQINFGPDRVGFFRIRSGGDLVEVDDDEVTFRYFDFEPTDARGSSVSGPLPSSELPRRFQLHGSLYQVDQTFRIHDGFCPPIIVLPPPPPPPPGGGVILSGSGNLSLHSFAAFDLSPDYSALFTSPSPGQNVLSRVTGGGGSLIPTLEELNISAPDGAVLTFDDDGLLTVESSGDITLSGSFPEIPGLISIRIIAGGDIMVLAGFEVHIPGSLEFISGGGDEIPGGVDPPIITPGCDVIVFDGLLPMLPAEKIELGTFSITASAATQVEIDVLPWRDPNELRLGTHQRVWVALLGSEHLDVSDVDPSTLRLGPAEAEPLTRRFGSPLSFLMEINWDAEHHRDLLTLFDVRKLGVAYGDTELCLSAQTYSGVTLEGCDRIDAMPTPLKRRYRRHKFRSHRGAHHRNH